MTDLLGILGFEDVDKKALFWGEEDGFLGSEDFLIWDVPSSIVALDDMVVSDSSPLGFQALGVPPLPKVLSSSLLCYCFYLQFGCLKSEKVGFFCFFEEAPLDKKSFPESEH